MVDRIFLDWDSEMPKILKAFDTETTGLRIHNQDKMFAFSLCGRSGKTEVHRIGGRNVWDEGISPKPALSRLKELWEMPNAAFVMHNAKFDIAAVEKELGNGFAENISIHDTFLQSHILQNHHPNHKLSQVAWELAGIPKDDESQVNKLTGLDLDYSTVPPGLMDEYQRRDVERCMLLHLFFYPKIHASPTLQDIYDNEIDLIYTTLRMERRGVMIQEKECRKMIQFLEEGAAEALAIIEKAAGGNLNPESPQQLSWLLFQKLGLPSLKKTASGEKSTSKTEVLLPLRETNPHPVIDAVLKFRSFSRGIVMIQQYLDFCDGNNVLHPSIKTCGAKTGRESCSQPNLQNVARAGVLLNPFAIPARKCFRPKPGYVNFHLDYSGEEMRLLVHYADEPELVEAARKGGDIHLPGAKELWGKTFIEELDKAKKKSMRDAAKNANFAIPYGANAAKVAQILNIPLKEAHLRLSKYRKRFPNLTSLNKRVAKQVEENGFVETTFGRRLNLPRSKGYMGTNYLIQGTAAEIIKRAQVRVDHYLKRATGDEAGILLPIHDELVIEFPRKRLGEAKHVLKRVAELMVDFPQFKVPLEVEAQIATVNWDSKQDFDFS